ncbi:MAG: carotenoid oxygenase [Burkholderiaceae bacterium]|nr:MAG: carotenoid oxygenase [Burkholderiaceae bacterium]
MDDAMNIEQSHPLLTDYAGLRHNTSDRADAAVIVSGTLPAELNGVLYRNGPGLFRRGAQVKHSLLDGDGVVQRLELANGQARYARRFVRTPKFIAEQAAGCFMHPTWTTRASAWRRNWGGNIPSQAGVTVEMANGVLSASDEVAPRFEIDPVSLETRAPFGVGLPDRDDGLKAHTRHLAASGDCLFVSTRMGRGGMQIDFMRHRRDGTRVATPTVPAPRMVYVHDFAATERYAIVALHPAFMRPLRFLTGFTSLTDSLAWRPQAGNLVLLIDLATGQATRYRAPTAWIWHFANAWEEGDAVVVDFVGYDDAGHFLGPDAQLTAVMQGHIGVPGAPGVLRRQVLKPGADHVEETVIARGNVEFPSVDGALGGKRHRRVYVNSSAPWAGALHSGVAAIDVERATTDAFDFGAHMHAGEPVFVPRQGGAPDQGWLVTETLDTRRNASGFVLLDAEHVADGPVAHVDLGEPVPLSFHGCWVAR